MKVSGQKGGYAVWAITTLLLLTLGGCSKQVKVEWNCKGTSKNSMQCEFRNNGQASGEACFDIVQICGNGEHVAHVCSGTIQPGSMDNKVVTSFSPQVGLLESCMGTEFRNKQITAQ